MSNRRKLRVPPRYERPAHLRPDLGDAEGEAAYRASWGAQRRDTARAAGLGQLRELGKTGRNRADRRQHHLPAATFNGHDLTPYLAGPRTVATVESAPAVEQCTLRETAGGGIRITEAKRDALGAMVVPINIIRSGWNSSKSRYYGAAMLERDVPLVYPKGTHMFMNHPTRTEEEELPERSLLTLAGVFAETPWATRTDDGGTMMCTEARIFGPWQAFLAEAAPYIGVSINGHGTGDHGEADGHHGFVVEALTYGQSVDFVTRPGAGGGIVTLVESAREADGGGPFTGPRFRAALDAVVRSSATREAATLGAYLESRIHLGFTQMADDLYGSGYVTRAERIAASSAVGDALAAFVAALEAKAPQLYQRGRYDEPAEADTSEAARAKRTRETSAGLSRQRLEAAVQTAYTGDDRYAWVCDYDPDAGTVWFETSQPAMPMRTWQQSYTVGTNGAVTLTGERLEVRARTVYEPIPKATETQDSAPADRGGAAVSEATTTPDGAPPARTAGTAPETTQERQAVMAEIPDNELAALRESATAGETARNQLTALTQERDGALAELAGYRAGATARPIIDALLAESDLPAAAANRVRAQFAQPGALPLAESTRALNEDALRVQVGASIKAEAAYLAAISESAGAGRVAGLGTPGTSAFAPAFGSGASTSSVVGGTATGALPTTATEALVESFKAIGMSPEAARAAALGRN